jgi:Pyruvate/2-oxoacid:ferredoxin oxidoreductase delta subunit
LVKIEINEMKCQSPRDCHRCLQMCPEGVFLNYQRQINNIMEWVVTPVFLSLCTGCKVCEDICPQKAITVSLT